MECNNVATGVFAYGTKKEGGGVRWVRGVAHSELIFVFEMQLMHEKQSEKIETFLHATNKGRRRQGGEESKEREGNGRREEEGNGEGGARKRRGGGRSEQTKTCYDIERKL